jgi:hypothetical protein
MQVHEWNVVSPLLSHWESEPEGEPIGQRVKGPRGHPGESEGRSVRERIGGAPPIRATSPHAKAGRLPPGLSSRET